MLLMPRSLCMLTRLVAIPTLPWASSSGISPSCRLHRVVFPFRTARSMPPTTLAAPLVRMSRAPSPWSATPLPPPCPSPASPLLLMENPSIFLLPPLSAWLPEWWTSSPSSRRPALRWSRATSSIWSVLVCWFFLFSHLLGDQLYMGDDLAFDLVDNTGCLAPTNDLLTLPANCMQSWVLGDL